MAKSFGGSFHRVNSHNIEIHTTTGDFPIARLIHDYSDLKTVGFIKANREAAYKVQEVTDNLVRVLNIYNESGLLTKDVFDKLIEAYRPFLRNYLGYEVMQRRVEESKSMEGWIDV